MSLKSLAILAAGAATVSAHGVILEITSAGKEYRGWDANYQYYDPVPDVAAWHSGGTLLLSYSLFFFGAKLTYCFFRVRPWSHSWHAVHDCLDQLPR